MNTFRTGKTIIHYNADLSNDVEICNLDSIFDHDDFNRLSVPGQDLIDFMLYYISRMAISKEENSGFPRKDIIAYLENLTSEDLIDYLRD